MLATALASSSSSWEPSTAKDSSSCSSSDDSPSSHCHLHRHHRHYHHHHLHHHHHCHSHHQESTAELANSPSTPSSADHHHHHGQQTTTTTAAAAGTSSGGKRSRERGPVHQIQLQLQLQHQRQQSYVYPKLQLVQIDSAWYALNQTCLQIYQQLQMCGTAQLMPVDVVPLHMLPDCVRKSLSSSETEHQENPGRHHDARDSSSIHQTAAGRRGDGSDDSGGPANDTLRIYDIMSDAAASTASGGSNLALHRVDIGAAGNDKSWWSRFFHGSNNSSSGSGLHAGSPTWMASCTRRHQGQQHPFHRRHRQIVQKLMEETSRSDNNVHATAPQGSKTADQGARHESADAGQFTCVVCQSVFPSHRLLQRHRERANHFGCTVCSKSFKSCSSLQDHCELLSHWSEEDSDEDSGDDFDSDEYLFSSETSDDE